MNFQVTHTTNYKCDNKIEVYVGKVETVGELIEALNTFDKQMKLDIRYDSGYGLGGIPDTFTIKENKLEIIIS